MRPVETQSLPEVKQVSLPPEEFLTTHELMKLLKVKHRKTIYDLIASGMPAILVGKNYRFMKGDVIHFLKERTRERGKK